MTSGQSSALPAQLSQWLRGNTVCDGLARSLEHSKCPGNNAFYRHHYLEVMRTAGLIRNKMDLACQAQGRSKLGEEAGAEVRRGGSPKHSSLPWDVCGHECEGAGGHAGLSHLSTRQMERAPGESGSSMAEKVGAC